MVSNVEKHLIATISLLTSDSTEIEHHFLKAQGLAKSLPQVHWISNVLFDKFCCFFNYIVDFICSFLNLSFPFVYIFFSSLLVNPQVAAVAGNLKKKATTRSGCCKFSNFLEQKSHTAACHSTHCNLWLLSIFLP